MASIRYASDAIGDITVVPPDPCSPCQTKYGTDSRVAGWYCIDCEEFICNDCKASHESFRTLRQHKIVTHTQGVERKETFRELAELETCKVHKGKMLEFFCPSHTTFCCSVCIAEIHKKCGTTPQILERNRGKIIGSSPDLLKVLQGLQKKMEDIQKQFDSNKKNIEKLRFDLPSIFKSLRKDILNLLDKAEETLQLELQEIIKKEEQKTFDYKTRTSSLEKSLQSSVNLLEGSHHHGTEAQKIISEYEIKTKSKKYEHEIAAVKGAVTGLDMSVNLQPNFVNLLENQENIFNVSIQGPQRTSVSKLPKPFRNRKAKFISTVPCKSKNDKEKPWITGVTFLADDKLVLADNNNNKVKLYNRDLTYTSELVLDSKPRDVTAYDKDKVAVTVPDKNKFRLLTVKQKISPLQTISVPYECRGISSLGNDRFILTADLDIVVIVDIHGTEMNRLMLDEGNLYNPLNVVLNATKTVAYVSSFYNDKLCAVDVTSNKILFTYQHDDLKYPCGVIVDKDGNVYVCCEGSHNVHQISAEGKLIQILLSQNDNVKYPTAVCFGNDGQRLLLTDKSDDISERVKIYSMK